MSRQPHQSPRPGLEEESRSRAPPETQTLHSLTGPPVGPPALNEHFRLLEAAFLGCCRPFGYCAGR